VDVLLPSASEITTADSWFAGLDRRPLVIGALQLTMQVLGVHLDAFNTWIQIELGELPDSSLLVRLMPWATVGDAIEIVRSEIAATFCSDTRTEPLTHEAGDCRHLFLPIVSRQIATA